MCGLLMCQWGADTVCTDTYSSSGFSYLLRDIILLFAFQNCTAEKTEDPIFMLSGKKKMAKTIYGDAFVNYSIFSLYN